MNGRAATSAAWAGVGPEAFFDGEGFDEAVAAGLVADVGVDFDDAELPHAPRVRAIVRPRATTCNDRVKMCWRLDMGPISEAERPGMVPRPRTQRAIADVRVGTPGLRSERRLGHLIGHRRRPVQIGCVHITDARRAERRVRARTLLHDESCDDTGTADEQHADDPRAKPRPDRLFGQLLGPASNSPATTIDLRLDRSTSLSRCVLRMPSGPSGPVAGRSDHSFGRDGKVQFNVSNCVDAFAGAAAHGVGQMLTGGDGFGEIDAHTHARIIPRRWRWRNAATLKRIAAPRCLYLSDLGTTLSSRIRRRSLKGHCT